MRHNYILEQYGARIRPVKDEDAQFIINLRNAPHVQGGVGSVSPKIEDQLQWLNDYYFRENDYYFIIEDCRSNKPLGTVGLYDIVDKVGESGRWIMVPDTEVPIVIPSLLIFKFAFEVLNLKKIVYRVVSKNEKVLKFHKLLGAEATCFIENDRIINGIWVDMQCFEVTFATWIKIKEKWSAIL